MPPDMCDRGCPTEICFTVACSSPYTLYVKWFRLKCAIVAGLTFPAHGFCAPPIYEEAFARFGVHATGQSSRARLVQAADGNFYGTADHDGVGLGGTAYRVT